MSASTCIDNADKNIDINSSIDDDPIDFDSIDDENIDINSSIDDDVSDVYSIDDDTIDDANNNHNQALIAAIKNHQVEEVRNLLEHHLDKIDINGGDPTPLYEACRVATTDARIVALLLEKGADPNHKQEEVEMNGERYYSNENSPILFATNDALSHLLRCGARPNVIDLQSGWAPLHYRCRDVQYHEIELLLRNGANPNQPNREGEAPNTLLDDNFNDNHRRCLRLLLKHGAIMPQNWRQNRRGCYEWRRIQRRRINGDDISSNQWWRSFGDTSARTGGDDINEGGFIKAIRKQQFKAVMNLLENNRYDINVNGGYPTPLCVACEEAARTDADARIVALLLEKGADPNHGKRIKKINGEYYDVNEYSPIWKLGRKGATNDVLSHLLRCGADPNAIKVSSGWSPLHFVCHWGDYDKIDLLLQYGANLDQLDINGESPMFRLLSKPNIVRFRGFPPLPCLQLLLERGANPNVVDKSGETPVFKMIRFEPGEYRDYRLDVIRLMTRHGADFTIPIPESRTDDTILHDAVRLRDVDAVRAMTECQAITTFWWLRNDPRDTVYDLAVKLEAAPIIEYFDMKLRQESYGYLLYNWISKSCSHS